MSPGDAADGSGSERGHRGTLVAQGVGTLFRDQRVNAGLCWLLVALLVLGGAASLAVGDPLSAAFDAGLVALVVVVPVSYRSVQVTLPWELVAVASVPTLGRAVIPGPLGIVATYLAVAAAALILAVELHAFTDEVSMSYSFAALFVVVTTLATAGVWALTRWIAGLTLGTTPLTDETALMWEFVGSTVAGGAAGLVLRPYLSRRAYTDRIPTAVARFTERRYGPGGTVDGEATPAAETGTRPETGTPHETRPERGPGERTGRWYDGRLRDWLGISPGQQVVAARLMEYTLVGLLFVGLERRALGIVVNAGVALLVVQLPPILERDHEIPMDPAVTLWITAAAFLHALGTVGIPGSETTFYRTVWWWDHLTHALSASVVAAVGYATVRAVDRHSDAVSLPPRFVFVFILSFVLAFGVLWEVLEFALGGLGDLTGGSVLTQYGLEDTMVDLLFNLAGGIVAATWGTAHLADVTGALVERLERRRTDES